MSGALLEALPWLLLLSFVVFPVVSATSFRAFSCEAFDDGRSYLKADFAIVCDGEAHRRSKRLAWVGIVCYSLGVPALYAVLLWRARRAILDRQPTPLSKALAFLVRDYEGAFLWWELLETSKKARPQCRPRSTRHTCSTRGRG